MIDMIKKFITSLFTISSVMLFDSCVNEEFDSENKKEQIELKTFCAYNESYGTKAAINQDNSKEIIWSEGDELNYFGGALASNGTTSQYLKLDAGEEGKTMGHFSGAVSLGSQDYVLFPRQLNASISNGVITAEIPMTQYAEEGTFDSAAALMVGEVEGNNIYFHNVMSFVRVTIPSGVTKCKQVTIKAKNAWTTMAGKIRIKANNGSGWTVDTAEDDIENKTIWDETITREGQAFVRLVPKPGTQYLGAGKTYYIAILPQEMTTGFEIYFNDNDVIKVKQSSDNPVLFKRSTTKKLQEITSFNYTITSTVIAGLNYANRNIGASTACTSTSNNTDESTFGDYFQWGDLRPIYKRRTAGSTLATNDLYKEGGYIEANAMYYGVAHSKLAASEDIATMLWGGKWRMPTDLEVIAGGNDLKNATPLAGSYEGTSRLYEGRGYIWTSTPSGMDGNCYSCYGPTYNNSSLTYRYQGMCVRPILDMDEQNLLPGEFTVNSSGGKVRFTKGNLYWNGSSFDFESKQYNYPTTWSTSHVGHFFWTKTEANAYKASYGDGTNSTGDAFFARDVAARQYAMTINGSTGLRALTNNEWTYLLTNASEIILVNGKRGIVLKPDGYSGTVSSSYTIKEWATAEADGLVFLPYMGKRSSSYSTPSISSTTMGYYWSSIASTSSAGKAWVAHLYANTWEMEDVSRGDGYSVRLVKRQ